MVSVSRFTPPPPSLRSLACTLIAAAALCAPVALCAPAIGAPQGHPSLSAGAIATSDIYGARAARQIMDQGGNVADAAIAVAFVEAVTYPEAGNLGGGGFLTLWFDGHPYFLDYRETAPAAAVREMFLDARGEVIESLSLVGNLSAGVPGTVRGMGELHRRFARLPWTKDLAPAIRLAHRGFIVDQNLIEHAHSDDVTAFHHTTNFDRYFGAARTGHLLRQPELAATLTRIARGGPDEFYRGSIADLLVAQMQRGSVKGIITKADLRAYRAVWRAPLTADWHGFEVITAPPPSSGGIALMQMLTMKDDASRLFTGVPLNSPQYIHLVAEIEKRVFADRAEYLGDPDFVNVPVHQLMDRRYLAERAAAIDPARPSTTAAVSPGLEKPQTTHFSIVDRWGNAASNTYTLNGWFGSGVVVQGAGFLLNDEMDDFAAKAGAPNGSGVVGGDFNAIAPGKRPLSSMTPTILTRDGKVSMVIGTPGASRIFTSIFQVLVDVYDFHLPLQDAQRQVRFHHQLLPDNVIFNEPWAPFTPELVAGLEDKGYSVQQQDWNGDVEAIEIVGRQPVPVADPRARGVALTIY